MTINDMKLHLMAEYPNSLKWKERVNHMAPNQVIAIFKSIQERKAREHAPKPVEENHQIDIFEYLASIQEAGSHTQIAL